MVTDSRQPATISIAASTVLPAVPSAARRVYDFLNFELSAPDAGRSKGGMQKISTKTLELWRAKLDQIEREIEVVVGEINASPNGDGPLLERLNHLHELKQTTDREVQYISETLLASRFGRRR